MENFLDRIKVNLNAPKKDTLPYTNEYEKNIFNLLTQMGCSANVLNQKCMMPWLVKAFQDVLGITSITPENLPQVSQKLKNSLSLKFDGRVFEIGTIENPPRYKFGESDLRPTDIVSVETFEKKQGVPKFSTSKITTTYCYEKGKNISTDYELEHIHLTDNYTSENMETIIFTLKTLMSSNIPDMVEILSGHYTQITKRGPNTITKDSEHLGLITNPKDKNLSRAGFLLQNKSISERMQEIFDLSMLEYGVPLDPFSQFKYPNSLRKNYGILNYQDIKELSQSHKHDEDDFTH